MFEFMKMAGTYEQKKVDNFEMDGIEIDTAMVTDYPATPYETGLLHPKYNDGRWIIVESYKNKEDAQDGHVRWVTLLEFNNLPDIIKDCRDGEKYKRVV